MRRPHFLFSCCTKCSLVELLIRVLYRIRFLSEQTPFDPATFSYAFPLLSQILHLGGVSAGEEDDPLEQVALSVEIVKFHSNDCR